MPHLSVWLYLITGFWRRDKNGEKFFLSKSIIFRSDLSLWITLSLSLSFSCPIAYGVPWPGIRSKPQLWPKLQRWQCLILSPLFQAGNQTCVPGLPRHWGSCCTKAGTPRLWILSISEQHSLSAEHELESLLNLFCYNICARHSDTSSLRGLLSAWSMAEF